MERGAETERLAELGDSDAPWVAFGPKVEKAKNRSDTAHAAVIALDDWAAFYLRRGRPDRALPLLDEADAVPLPISYNRYRRRRPVRV